MPTAQEKNKSGYNDQAEVERSSTQTENTITGKETTVESEVAADPSLENKDSNILKLKEEVGQIYSADVEASNSKGGQEKNISLDKNQSQFQAVREKKPEKGINIRFPYAKIAASLLSVAAFLGINEKVFAQQHKTKTLEKKEILDTPITDKQPSVKMPDFLYVEPSQDVVDDGPMDATERGREVDLLPRKEKHKIFKEARNALAEQLLESYGSLKGGVQWLYIGKLAANIVLDSPQYNKRDTKNTRFIQKIRMLMTAYPGVIPDWDENMENFSLRLYKHMKADSYLKQKKENERWDK